MRGVTVSITGNKPNQNLSLSNVSGLVIGEQGPTLQGSGVAAGGGAGFSTAGGSSGGDGDGGVTPPPAAPVPLKLFMHVGQLDWQHENRVVQSAILNESKYLWMTDINDAFSGSGATTVTPYTVSPSAVMPPDLSTAGRYTGLIKVNVSAPTHFIMYRHYDDNTGKGIKAGGTVLRNEGGHIIRNFGFVGGPSMDKKEPLSSLFNTSYGTWEYRGSRPILLQHGTYAGMIASPAFGETESIIQFVNPEGQFFISNTATAEIDAAASGVGFDPNYGCAFTEALDGDIVTVMKTATGMTLKKHNPSTVSGSGEQIEASINIAFTFWAQDPYYQLPKFSIITLNNGNYFVVWCNAQDGDGTNGTDNASVNHCIVSADLSSVVVAPTLTNGDALVASWFPCATKLNNGNVAVCWLQYDYPTSYGYPIFIKGAVFSQTGATVVAPTELYNCGNPTRGSPIAVDGEAIRVTKPKDNGSICLSFYFYNYPESYPVIINLDSSLNISGQYQLQSQDQFFAYRSADEWFKRSDLVSIENYVFMVSVSDDYYDSDKKIAIYGILTSAIGRKKIYTPSITYATDGSDRSIYATVTQNFFRIDTLWSGDLSISTFFVDPITLNSFPQSESSGQLFYALEGAFYIDATNEWDNTEISIATISKAQSDTLTTTWTTTPTNHISDNGGSLNTDAAHRFYVEVDSDSFVFGSGVDDTGFPEGFSGSLARIAIDIVKPFPVKYTFNDVGYMDINANGTYTQPKFITQVPLQDGDVIQLREINFVGDLIDQFQIAEATVMLQCENEASA